MTRTSGPAPGNSGPNWREIPPDPSPARAARRTGRGRVGGAPPSASGSGESASWEPGVGGGGRGATILTSQPSFQQQGAIARPRLLRFGEAELRAELVETLEREFGITEPFAVQEALIRILLAGKSALAEGSTGSGKTFGAMLPLFHRLAENPVAESGRPRVVWLVNTRPLQEQTVRVANQLGQALGVKAVEVVSETSSDAQMEAIRDGAQVIVATTAGLRKLRREQPELDLEGVEALVVDEPDELLSGKFLGEVNDIVEALPPSERRQTVVMGATFPEQIKEVARALAPGAVEVRTEQTPLIDQRVVFIDGGTEEEVWRNKQAELLSHLRNPENRRILVVANTIEAVDRLHSELVGASFHEDIGQVAKAHSRTSKTARREALEGLRAGDTRVMVVTDMYGRGIDAAGIDLVMQWDVPPDLDLYLQRIGRTGRAGAEGIAIILVAPSELDGWETIARGLPTPPAPKTPLPSALRQRVAWVEGRPGAVFDQNLRAAVLELIRASPAEHIVVVAENMERTQALRNFLEDQGADPRVLVLPAEVAPQIPPVGLLILADPSPSAQDYQSSVARQGLDGVTVALVPRTASESWAAAAGGFGLAPLARSLAPVRYPQSIQDVRYLDGSTPDAIEEGKRAELLEALTSEPVPGRTLIVVRGKGEVMPVHDFLQGNAAGHALGRISTVSRKRDEVVARVGKFHREGGIFIAMDDLEIYGLDLGRVDRIVVYDLPRNAHDYSNRLNLGAARGKTTVLVPERRRADWVGISRKLNFVDAGENVG